MSMKISKMSRITDRQSPAGEVMAPDQILSLIVAFFRRQYPIVLMALVATTLVALGYLLIVRSTYTAQATILMDTRKVQVQQQSMFNDAPIDAPTVESQVEIIKSDKSA